MRFGSTQWRHPSLPEREGRRGVSKKGCEILKAQTSVSYAYHQQIISREGKAYGRHSGRMNNMCKVGMREKNRIMDQEIIRSGQSWSGE